MKKQTGKKEKRTQDRYTVVLEELNSKMDLLVEGHQDLNKNYQKLNFKVDFLTEGHQILNSKVDFLTKGHNLLFEDFKSLKVDAKSDFKTILGYLSRIDDELQDIKVEIKSLKIELKDKAGLERVIALERKVNMLENILIKQKMLKV